MNTLGRDIAISELSNEQLLVTACDSCGAIGNKELDIIQVPAELVGALTARVALLEVMSVGADPRVISVAISAEPAPTGQKIIKGVREELAAGGLNDISLIVSTEKNTPTRQTGLGISVTGVCDKKNLQLGLSQPGDHVYCLGVPRVGQEVAEVRDSSLVNPADISYVRTIAGIHDIVPVGSGGLDAEISQLNCHLNLGFKVNVPVTVDLKKSAGPSTCVLFSCSHEQELQSVNDKPITKIGMFVSED